MSANVQNSSVATGLEKFSFHPQQRMRWFDSISDSMDMKLSKLWKRVRDREAWHAAVNDFTKGQTCLSD